MYASRTVCLSKEVLLLKTCLRVRPRFSSTSKFKLPQLPISVFLWGLRHKISSCPAREDLRDMTRYWWPIIGNLQLVYWKHQRNAREQPTFLSEASSCCSTALSALKQKEIQSTLLRLTCMIPDWTLEPEQLHNRIDILGHAEATRLLEMFLAYITGRRP